MWWKFCKFCCCFGRKFWLFLLQKKRKRIRDKILCFHFYIWYLCDISHKIFGMAVSDSVYGRKMIHIHSVCRWKVMYIHGYVR
jgi:hypothetical protein